ncbi:MAG TPA: transcriptional regulator [Microlunatus sp.]|nr:transcriptional regulator [Microlunatus sp.]
MTGHSSDPALLSLHAVRLAGMAATDAVADRFALRRAEAEELLLDFQAFGWLTWVDFAGTNGWTLTAAGRAENDRRLARELDETGSAAAVRGVYERFLPHNAHLQKACTDWQLRPTPADPLSVNDHLDPIWDRPVLDALDVLDAVLVRLVADLTTALDRFAGYDERFDRALGRALAGDPAWVTGVGIDSCHTVWMELHEDLLATLGIARGAEPLLG